ncbi:MAG TPA: ATP-binding protein [Candidatus Limnocylindrales bacterium]|nr:ATP-binding protein [Candidatus Limnocylindrales bacterium]
MSEAPNHAPAATRSLHLEAGVERGAAIRAFVREAVAAFGGSPRVAEDLVQAVDEAACNVAIHGYRGRDGELDLEAASRDGRIEIRILDRAPVFDPTAAPDPDTTRAPVPTRPGGMGVGIHLVRTMTDAVRHHVRPGGGNELVLIRSMDDGGRGEAEREA